MPRKFDYFIIFAEMRTGSNFLESNLSRFPSLFCYGEAFNPSFLVEPTRKDLFGVTRAIRDHDPVGLIDKMKENTDGLPGFRFFHDHDDRVFEAVINDPRCAKIVLTRNLVESYVSHRIAQETNQWRLGDMKNAKTAKITFDPVGFEKLLVERKAFQVKIMQALQISGQCAFYIDYEDIQDLNVINGLARYLGEETQLEEFSGATKKQNPAALADKVTNFGEMEAALNRIDHYDLGRLPNFEPRRGPMVPRFVATENTPLLFMPVQGGPSERISKWLAAVNGTDEKGLLEGFTQKTLRQWKRKHAGHRSFTVLSHPAQRLHNAFCRHFLGNGPGTYPEIRRVLQDRYELPLTLDGAQYDRDAHYAAFLKFAVFVKGNLAGQTSVRVDASWASQSRIIQGFGQFILPDHILREDNLAQGLSALTAELDAPCPNLPENQPDEPFTLEDIYDEQVEKAVRAAYQRDYLLFGFGSWR
ncbi:MAG: nodulation protein NodH [Rhodobacteraceae bacterium]|nr:nodulation protein NodH [Paracoccaceae bacterium]